MNPDYKILFFNFIISIFMALSLNSFVSSNVFLSALFLYFISSLATFLDKAMYYRDNQLHTEKMISIFVFLVCLITLCFYAAYALNFIEIRFVLENTYQILMQGIDKSFFTFNSINITPITISFVATIPLSSLSLFLISYLRHYGYTKAYLFNTLKGNRILCTTVVILSLLCGLLGRYICHVKFSLYSKGYGTPQYHKYFFVFFFLCFVLSFLIFAAWKKPKPTD